MTLLSALILLLSLLLAYAAVRMLDAERFSIWLGVVVLLAALFSSSVSIGLAIATLLRVVQQ
ncbi:exported hypothetical protein [Thiomonas sp. CB3]|nr:exported hypothetical protein [Thiomonas sp. CB3]